MAFFHFFASVFGCSSVHGAQDDVSLHRAVYLVDTLDEQLHLSFVHLSRLGMSQAGIHAAIALQPRVVCTGLPHRLLGLGIVLVEHALALGITQCYVQERRAASREYVPEFDGSGVIR